MCHPLLGGEDKGEGELSQTESFRLSAPLPLVNLLSFIVGLPGCQPEIGRRTNLPRDPTQTRASSGADAGVSRYFKPATQCGAQFNSPVRSQKNRALVPKIRSKMSSSAETIQLRLWQSANAALHNSNQFSVHQSQTTHQTVPYFDRCRRFSLSWGTTKRGALIAYGETILWRAWEATGLG